MCINCYTHKKDVDKIRCYLIEERMSRQYMFSVGTKLLDMIETTRRKLTHQKRLITLEAFSVKVEVPLLLFFFLVREKIKLLVFRGSCVSICLDIRFIGGGCLESILPAKRK